LSDELDCCYEPTCTWIDSMFVRRGMGQWLMKKYADMRLHTPDLTTSCRLYRSSNLPLTTLCYHLSVSSAQQSMIVY